MLLGVTMDANFGFEQVKAKIGYSLIPLEEGFRKAFRNSEDRL
jgi:hypothetical protein